MTEAQAIEALVAANNEEGGRQEYGDAGPGAKPANPDNGASDVEPEAEVTPEGESQAVTPDEPVDSFTKLDPNALPAELQPYYKSMQGDYTRKSQELAEVRKQIEGITDLDEAKIAVDLLHSLGTPEGAQVFYGLLGEQLESLGLTPAQAAAVTQQVQEPTPVFEDDPEAALKWELDQMRSEVQGLRDSFAAERTAAQQEAQYYALAGEISRQESLIRDSNPHYTDDDINAVYELAAANGGNLVGAQQRYEAIVSDRVSRLLNSKTAAMQDTGVQPIGTPGFAEAQPKFDTLDQAHASAMEYLRQIEAQG